MHAVVYVAADVCVAVCGCVYVAVGYTYVSIVPCDAAQPVETSLTIDARGAHRLPGGRAALHSPLSTVTPTPAATRSTSPTQTTTCWRSRSPTRTDDDTHGDTVDVSHTDTVGDPDRDAKWGTNDDTVDIHHDPVCHGHPDCHIVGQCHRVTVCRHHYPRCLCATPCSGSLCTRTHGCSLG